jgi:hypothetical protein
LAVLAHPIPNMATNDTAAIAGNCFAILVMIYLPE